MEDELFLEVMRGSPVAISRREFGDLGNYSCSLPTGVRAGKVWRCAAVYERQEITDDWLLCCYHDIGSESEVGIARAGLVIETPRQTQARVIAAREPYPHVPRVYIPAWDEGSPFWQVTVS